MPDLLYVVAFAGLSLSGLAAAIRLIEWFIHADPRLMARTGRWAVAGLALLSVPLLLALLIDEKWTAAMVLGAVMLLAFAWYGPRLLQRVMRHRVAADWSSPPSGNLAPALDASIEDPGLVRRAIVILEEYLRRTAALPAQVATNGPAIGMQHSDGGAGAFHNGNARDRSTGPVSQAEALDILGLDADASEIEIKEAHQRLRELVGPGRGGSRYLTVKIDQAKAMLLGRMDEAPEGRSSRPDRLGTHR
jgi:hypothetical protein